MGENAPDLDGLAVEVEALFVHPVKACAGVAMGSLAFDASGGVVGDREWAVMDAEGAITWQGAVPRLALVRPVPVPGGLRLEAPGLPACIVAADEGSDREVRLWSDSAQRHEVFGARAAAREVNAWLSQAAGADVKLVRLGPEALGRDGLNPVHVVSRASVEAINERLAAQDIAALSVQRFRPNVVIRGPGLEAFDEDHLQRLRWPGLGLSMQVTAPCIRCLVLNVDPQTAGMSDAPLQAVAELAAQRQPGGPAKFGVYARASGRGRLSLGDRGVAQLAF
jgi:uncharacterized protein YcbX